MSVRQIAVVALLSGLLSWSASAAEPTRVVIVSSGESSAVDAVIDLATVALSQDESIEQLERQAVRNALAEQELSLAGSQGADSAIQVGRLLATDLVAVVEVEAESVGPSQRRSGKQPEVPAPVGLVVFDARTGTRLWDQALPSADPEKIAELVRAAVMSAVEKARSDAAKRKAVCLVTVRNASLPRSFDSYPPAMAVLLQRHLTGQPTIELLERRHLEHFNRERTLVAEAGERELAASAVLIEIDLARPKGADGVAAIAVLTDSSGKRLGSAIATVDESDLPLLTERLAESLVRELGQKFARSIADPRLEARRFRMESNSAVIHERFSDAIPAGEAAFALVSDDPGLGAELANTLARASRNLLFTKQFSTTDAELESATDAEVVQAIDWVLRSLAIRRTFYSVAQSSGNAEAVVADKRQFDHTGWAFPVEAAIETVMRNFRYLPPDVPRSAVVEAALQRLRTEWLDWQNEIAVDEPLAAAYERAHRMLMVGDPQACISLEAKWLMQWYRQIRNTVDRHPVSLRSCTYTARTLGGGWLTPDPDQCKPLMEAYKTIQDDDSHVLFQFMGLQGRAYLCRISNQPVSQDMLDAVRNVRHDMLEYAGRLIASGESVPIADKQLAYEAFFESTQWSWTGESQAERIEAGMVGFRSMLDLGVATNTMMAPLTMMLDAGEERWAELYGRIDDLERRHSKKQFATIVYWTSIATEIERIRQAILKRFPDLDPSRRSREWLSKRQVVAVEDVSGVDYLIIPMMTKTSVLSLGISHSTTPCRIALVESLLAGNTPSRVINKAEFTSTFISYRGLGLKCIRGVCRTDDAVFVATSEKGIVRLPIDGSPATWITTESGLLSDYTHGIAMLNGRLIVASGDLGSDGYVLGKEMYLQSLNIEDGTHEVIVSTRRKDRQSPFDDGPLFEVNSLTPDPERGRLLMMIQVQHRPGESGVDSNTGLWEYSPKTGFLQLAHGFMHFRDGFADSFPDDSRTGKMVLTDRNGVMSIRLADDKVDWIYRMNRVVAQNRIQSDARYKGPFALTDDSLWTFEPLGRLNVQTRQFERFADPADPERLGFNRLFGRWSQFLRVLPDREEMLYVDGKSIWLLGIPPTSAD
ncbi:MAG: hypothetical protein O3B13_14455 [Planctomycetota bacterium]|nr:hypothetical protein [Planctomycetota bacterium]